MDIEYCCICNEPTGRAGIAYGSIYCECELGPLCEDCWHDHYAVCPFAKESDNNITY
jgi:hypothetical protein